eukprot:15452620-Alexandrium_andersonii.AAC.1
MTASHNSTEAKRATTTTTTTTTTTGCQRFLRASRACPRGCRPSDPGCSLGGGYGPSGSPPKERLLRAPEALFGRVPGRGGGGGNPPRRRMKLQEAPRPI